MSMSTPRPLYGSFTSLYPTLPEHISTLVERAARLVAVQKYVEAESAFAMFGEEDLQHPVVALEYANLFLANSRHKKARAFLSSLRALDSGMGSEYQLLRILCARAEVYSQGRLHRVRSCLDENHKWLKRFAVEDCQDIHVRIIKDYAMLAKICCHVSNVFDGEFYGEVMTKDGEPLKPWQHLGALRKWCQERGRLSDAGCLLRVECVYYFHRGSRTAASREFIEACKERGDDSHNDPVRLREGLARIDQLKFLDTNDEKEEELAAAEACIRRDIPDDDLEGLELNLERMRIPLLPIDDDDRFHLWIMFTDRAEEASNFTQADWGLSGACDTANTLVEKSSTQENNQRIFSIYSRYDRFRRNLGDAYFLANSRVDVVSCLNKTDRHQSEIIEWWNQFDEDYPEFELWNLCRVREDDRLLSFKQLRDNIGVERCQEEKQANFDAELRFWSQAAQGVRKESYDFGYPSSAFSDHGEWTVATHSDAPSMRIWLMPEANEYGVDSLLTQVSRGEFVPHPFTYKTLLAWLRADHENGIISSDLLAFLLGIHDHSNVTMKDRLENMEPTELMDKSLPSVTLDMECQLNLNILEMWLLNTPSFDKSDRVYLLAKMQLDRIHQSMEYPGVEDKKKLYTAQARILKRFLDLSAHFTDELKAVLGDQIPRMQSQYGGAMFMSGTIRFSAAPEESLKYLDEAEEAYSRSRAHYLETQNIIQLANETTNIAHVESTRHLINPQHKLDRAFELLREVEGYLDELRQDYTLLGDAENLSQFSTRNTFLFSLFPYRRAVMSLWNHLGDFDPVWRVTEIWSWIQKSKARSMSEFMGTSCHLARDLVEKLEGPRTDECRKLLAEEQVLTESAKDVLASDARDLRKKISDLRRRMSEIPELKDIMDMRNGRPISLEHLDRINAVFPSDTIYYIDWFQQFPEKYTITIAKSSREPIFAQQILFPNEQLNKFLLLLSDSESSRKLSSQSSITQLSRFAPFIEPILERTQPGDTLVFSPCGPISGIPLHAINNLILRNPILYTPSLGLLHHAFALRINSSPSGQPPILIGGVDCPPSSAEICSSSISTISDILENVEILTQSASTSESVLSAFTSGPPLVHILSHAEFEPEVPLEHAILLPQGDLVTARDIFEIRATWPMHVTLVCCESGVVDSKRETDEIVLGLVPALMAVGAGSTVSTLWKVNESHGVKFSEKFYAEIIGQIRRGGNKGSYVNLAKAMQRAVIGMMNKGGQGDEEWVVVSEGELGASVSKSVNEGASGGLYEWAPYVLGGFWWLPWKAAAEGGGGNENGATVQVEVRS